MTTVARRAVHCPAGLQNKRSNKNEINVYRHHLIHPAARHPVCGEGSPAASEIVRRANHMALYQGQDTKGSVKMEIEDSQGRIRRRAFNILRKNADTKDRDQLYLHTSRPRPTCGRWCSWCTSMQPLRVTMTAGSICQALIWSSGSQPGTREPVLWGLISFMRTYPAAARRRSSHVD